MMNCRNCQHLCGAVEFIDPPYCCIACEEEFKTRLESKHGKY
jgi:hypothetical protein